MGRDCNIQHNMHHKPGFFNDKQENQTTVTMTCLLQWLASDDMQRLINTLVS